MRHCLQRGRREERRKRSWKRDGEEKGRRKRRRNFQKTGLVILKLWVFGTRKY